MKLRMLFLDSSHKLWITHLLSKGHSWNPIIHFYCILYKSIEYFLLREYIRRYPVASLSKIQFLEKEMAQGTELRVSETFCDFQTARLHDRKTKIASVLAFALTLLAGRDLRLSLALFFSTPTCRQAGSRTKVETGFMTFPDGWLGKSNYHLIESQGSRQLDFCIRIPYLW